MKKLFACDLDGTLLNEYHDTDEYINEGIKKVIESGNYISIATGRSLYQATMINFPKGMYIICANGALIVDSNRNVLYKNIIPKYIIQDFLEHFSHLPIEYVSIEEAYCTTSKKEFVDNLFLEETIKNGAPKEEDIFLSNNQFDIPKEKILNSDICKINFFIRHGLQPELKKLLEKYKDELVNAATNEDLIELTTVTVNKGESVQYLANHLGLSEEQIFVYGDAGNDIEMLKRFKYAYVPSSGLDIAKQYACQIIGANTEYSVINHIIKEIED